MNLLLFKDLIIEHLLSKPAEQTDYDFIRDHARRRGDRMWIHMASLPVCVREVNTRINTSHQPHHARDVLESAQKKLLSLLQECSLLASLSDEAEALLGENPELACARIAMSRLPRPVKRITYSKEHDADAITPAEYLELPADKPPMPFIDLERQQHRLRAGLERAIHRVLHHGQYILGPEIDELESALARYVQVRHAITVASGTDALLIALMALDVGPGDEVITVPYTWISTAEVIALLRARPVFVDVEWDTMNMDPALLEAAITPNTKAIIPVGIFGQCADMTRINAIAATKGIPVIEDAAQCFGATHYGRKSCSLSLVGCTSFFPSKPLGCYGDGGAIFTNDDALAEKMRQIRVHGQKIKHQHPLIGLNGRMDTLQAAIVLEKLKVFDEECRLRREVARRYDVFLEGHPRIHTPRIRPENTSVYAQYTIRLDNPEAAGSALQKEGIPSVSYYKTPLHMQGAFSYLHYKKGDFPVSERIAETCLSLPMSPMLTPAEQQRITEILWRLQ